MVIIKEKSPTGTEKIAYLYGQLHVYLSDLANAFIGWRMKHEGWVHEAKDYAKDALTACRKIIEYSKQLQQTEKKYKFNTRSLADRYRDDLELCIAAISGIGAELNAIWLNGQPAQKSVPFGNETNFKFIIYQLVIGMNRVNETSKIINKKTEKFNRDNKDLVPLPSMQLLNPPPSWVNQV